MPIYEYECPNCGTKFEKLQSFSAKKISKCPECNRDAKRVISLGSFVLKGSGWYVTDHPSSARQTGMQKEKHPPAPVSTTTSSDTTEKKEAKKTPEKKSTTATV